MYIHVNASEIICTQRYIHVYVHVYNVYTHVYLMHMYIDFSGGGSNVEKRYACRYNTFSLYIEMHLTETHL